VAGGSLAEKIGATYGLHESADVARPFEPLREGRRGSEGEEPPDGVIFRLLSAPGELRAIRRPLKNGLLAQLPQLAAR
jgi:hypothetical protein